MQLREVEEWRERGCNSCNSRDGKVKELSVGMKDNNSLVIALCKKCRNELFEILALDLYWETEELRE